MLMLKEFLSVIESRARRARISCQIKLLFPGEDQFDALVMHRLMKVMLMLSYGTWYVVIAVSVFSLLQLLLSMLETGVSLTEVVTLGQLLKSIIIALAAGCLYQFLVMWAMRQQFRKKISENPQKRLLLARLAEADPAIGRFSKWSHQ
jgi:hypothetical protein